VVPQTAKRGNLGLCAQAATIDRRPSLHEALYDFLDSIGRVISYILEEPFETKIILPTKTSSAAYLDAGGRTKYVFNESGLLPMKQALRDQVQAAHLLLSVTAL
jgi:hypothetical protein